jgi:hypothetical protein
VLFRVDLKTANLEFVDFRNEITVLLFTEVELVLAELPDFGNRTREIFDLAPQLRNLLNIRLHFVVTLLNESLGGCQLCLEIRDLTHVWRTLFFKTEKINRLCEVKKRG